MEAIKKFKDSVFSLLGFKSNSKYVRNYLNEANVRSSIYMAAIIIVLEIWMIIRQFQRYIIVFLSYDETKYAAFHEAGYTKAEFFEYYYTKWGYSGHVGYIFNSISFYILFILAAVAVLIYAISYFKNTAYHRNKKYTIANIIISSICILWIFMLIPQKIPTDNIGKWTTILMYVSLMVLGATILLNTIYTSIRIKARNILSIVVISSFACLCLLFGIKIGYSDFAHTTENMEKYYMITCFLTMVIFVSCLLIFKPYISILMNTTIFVVFAMMLDSFEGREFLDGDRVNYITFLVSLTMITISIYQQRVSEASKDRNLEFIASFDELTDIYNFQHFCKEIIEKQTAHAESIKGWIYLFFNIENFKAYNDKRTFEAGDELLLYFGHDIRDEFLDGITARQGDDHFVVFAPNDDIEERLDVLSKRLKNLDPELKLELKVGSYIPTLYEKPNRAVDKARYACGSCKNRYDKHYATYDDAMDSFFHKKQYIINNLDKAIEEGWIIPYYQPVVWSNDKKLCGCEALARWKDPDYGLLSPKDFIPILEECRLIQKLDVCIWESVCKTLRSLLDSGERIVPVSLNFSRIDFELMDVPEIVEGLITKYKLDKRYIHIEVTESALSDSQSKLEEDLLKLKTLGYAIWLDDFGSGYSSLNVLKDYEFDVVKLDMKFLTNFDDNKKSRSILESIIDLSSRIGMNTLTEGVETKTQADFLNEVGCGRLQGYLYGRPITKEELLDGIHSGKYVIGDILE